MPVKIGVQPCFWEAAWAKYLWEDNWEDLNWHGLWSFPWYGGECTVQTEEYNSETKD